MAFFSHQSGPGSIPDLSHVWTEFVVGSRLVLRGLQFSPPQKPTTHNSNSTLLAKASIPVRAAQNRVARKSCLERAFSKADLALFSSLLARFRVEVTSSHCSILLLK